MLSEEAKAVIAQCRALVISRKNAIVSDLVRDYREFEGKPLNFRRFGFSTVEEFLKASEQFELRSVQGETIIKAYGTKETEHLTRMIARQKCPKKQPNRKPYACDQSWNKSTFASNVYPKLSLPRKTRRRRNKSSDNNNNCNKPKPNGQMLTTMNFNQQKEKPNIASNRQIDTHEILQTKHFDLRQHLDAKKNALLNGTSTRPILGQNIKESMPEKKNSQAKSQTEGITNPKKVTKLPKVDIASETAKPTYESKKIEFSGLREGLTTVSVQDRLKLRRPQQGPTATEREVNVAKQTTGKTPSKQTTGKTPVFFDFDPRMDSIRSLELYCQVRNFNPPEYKIIGSKLPGIKCQVRVNNSTYSTYPEEYAFEAEAKTACANVAIKQIQINEARNRYPICMDTDIELAMKIFQELRNHPYGVMSKDIPALFQTTFEQTLPNNWFSVIESSRQFIIEEVNDNSIVLANFESSDSSSTSSASDSDLIALHRINLPWHEKYWNLYITHSNSTIDVWARIVGNEYSDQLDNIMTDVDLSMLTSKTRPTSIVCNQIYLISVSECWHRVRVEKINKSTEKCFCFFIDFGDEEWLPMDQLFVCEPRFLRLAPQAIPLSLYGLEDFAENPNAKIHLDSMLIGKTLIGEILTKRDTFEVLNDADFGFNARIQVVLYDTSSNEDVNLNPKLLKKICDDTPPPELKRTGATNVNITHVNANGEIFVQVKNFGLSYVQKLINQLVDSKFKEEEHQVVLADLKKPDSLFLIQDMDNMKWYRGALVPEENKINGNQYNIFYVDSGMTKLTNISRIFRLESLSVALSKFPRQALPVKLHNLPPINESIVAQIRGLLPTESPAIVKLAVYAIVPQVIIYRRFDANERLFNVNEVIRIEYELETSSDVQDDVESSAGTINDSIITDMRCNSAGSTHGSIKSPLTVPASPQKNDLQKLNSNVSIPPIDDFFDVFVSMTSNPSNFVIQPYCEGPKLAELMTSLQEYCKNNDEFIPGDMVEKGQAYAAPNSDGVFHRVTVENIFDSETILVCYCDFGEVAVVSNDKLKTLPAKFRTLSKQAIMAKLHGIKPKHGDWTMDDCMRFRELAVGQRFVSIIKNIADDAVCPNSQVIELQLVDVKTSEDIYIHEVLIHEGRAVADV